jgi:hypothetical protein
MKVAHWVHTTSSGMGRVAGQLSTAERTLGIDSIIADPTEPAQWTATDDADIHVIHQHIPLKILYDKKPKVWVAHGTPEVMFKSGVEEGLIGGHWGHSDAWMMAQHWLKIADVVVTFWPRHEAIWKSMSHKRTRIEGVPLGVDKEFWKPLESQGRFAGTPSVLTGENGYEMKWPLDLFIAWPWVVQDELYDAKLHAIYLPKDQHRWFFPLLNANGAGFHGYYGPQVFSDVNLRNAFCSVDHVIGLVRYGDMNRLSLEANACGASTISYAGNPYSSYWVDFTDQRVLAAQISAILKKQTEPRVDKSEVPSLSTTAERMKAIYDSL